jgi:hypothetical protein
MQLSSVFGTDTTVFATSFLPPHIIGRNLVLNGLSFCMCILENTLTTKHENISFSKFCVAGNEVM